ncbi:MAG: YhcH/YjgK/YiaL family protein [Dysgonamonadaceae bacterium]|jgi:YhcH/YjgK/YiaL family protein|nr:YhcH/YjgK/YiaL family protein [Dysgonamonadaceae bacterium]
MIIDSLKNAAAYESLHPYFKPAFDFIRNSDLTQLAAGKQVIITDKLIVNISETNLKNPPDAKLEVHNQFIDIQIPVSTAESFGWKQRETCENSTQAYNAEKDVAFFGDAPSTIFTLQPNEFVIFFPGDAHAPCIGEGTIKKIIIKVLV